MSAHDIWAVGWIQDGEYNGTYALHWNGSRWHMSIQPRLRQGESGLLTTVAAGPQGDLWTGSDSGAVFHWSGYSWDRSAPTPAGKKFGRGVTTILPETPHDVSIGGDRIAHFDGHAWSVVANPVTANGTVEAMAGFGQDDIWAAGLVGSPTSLHATIEHWDGQAWAVAKLDSVPGNVRTPSCKD